jgi:hypothetical protein
LYICSISPELGAGRAVPPEPDVAAVNLFSTGLLGTDLRLLGTGLRLYMPYLVNLW